MNSALGPDRFAPGADAAADDVADDAGDAAVNAVDTGTIAWLLPEIANAFDAATAALRTFRGDAAGVDRRDVDLAPLRVARSHLHQAHGALEIGEIAGVTRLTEAIEELLASFETAPEKCDANALGAVGGACRAIVEYLEDLQGGEPQQPLRLYPSYRDLLTARGVDRIHPADLFLADLDVRAPKSEGGQPLDPVRLKEQRAAFEQALLRYIRNDRDSGALAALDRAVAGVDDAVAASARQGQVQQRAFWWATRALFEALAADGFEHARAQHAHLKRLAGRINLQIRKLVDGSPAVAERLYTDVLFFVAIAAPVTPLVREVQTRFRLAGAVPVDYETQRYGRIDPVALRAARDAIGAAKTAWSAIVGGDTGQIRAFAKETGALTVAVGPLRRPGLAQVAHVIDGIATDLGFDPRQPTPAVGLDVATGLLFAEGALERARSLDDAFDRRAAVVSARIEASVVGAEHPPEAADWLDHMSRKAEERLTVATFVGELQANLRNAEKVLDAFFRDPAERAGLQEAQDALRQVSGALALLGHDDVHRAIDHVRESIDRFRQDTGLVDEAGFQELAQSLGAVGFYVEQIKRERIDADAFHFDAQSGRFSADMARAPAVEADAAADDVAAPVAESSPPPAAPVEPVEPPVLLADFDMPDESTAAPARPEVPRAAAPQYDPFAATDIAFAATEILDVGDDADATLEDEIARRAADAQQHAALLRLAPDDAAERNALVAAVDDVRRNAMLIDDRPLYDEAAALLASLQDVRRGPFGATSPDQLAARIAELVSRANRSAGLATPSALPLEPAMPVPDEDNVEAIDAELLEIFLEEAGTVLVDADASMRVLDADPANATAAVNLRRGFHTLKGSGRMVGLMSFGDAAWGIEETLNDHIASQRPASQDLRALIDYAIRYLGDWADELRRDGHSARLPDALIEAARTVREGGRPATPPPFRTVAPVSLPDSLSDSPPVSLPVSPAEASRDAPVEDDFTRTEFGVRASADDGDAYFAATQVLGADADIPDLEFFGMQPTLRDAPAAEATTPPFDEPDFAALSFGPEPVATDPSITPAVVDARSDESDLGPWLATPTALPDDPTFFATTEPPPAPANRPEDLAGSLLDLDFDTPATTTASSDRVAAADGEAGREELVPTGLDDVAAAPSWSDAQPPAAVRGDDVRQIGSLTLSVALFNIYLTEADELLRVLTQDFSEWRHELDRFVSDGAMRAAHSLAGSSATVGLAVAQDLAAAIEEVLQQLWREPVEMREDQVGLLQDAVESLRKMLHRFAAERLPDADPLRIAGLVALRRELAGDGTPTARVDAADQARYAAALPFDPLDFGDEPVQVPSASPVSPSPVDEAVDAEPAGLDATVPIDDAFGFDEAIELAPPPDDPAFEIDEAIDLSTARSELPAAGPDPFDAITTIGASEMPFDADDVVDRWMTVDEDPAVNRPFDKVGRDDEVAMAAAPSTNEFGDAGLLPVATAPVPAADTEPANDSGLDPFVAHDDAQAGDPADERADVTDAVLDAAEAPPSDDVHAAAREFEGTFASESLPVDLVDSHGVSEDVAETIAGEADEAPEPGAFADRPMDEVVDDATGPEDETHDSVDDPAAVAVADAAAGTIGADALPARRAAPVVADAVQDDLDPELLDIFVAEGGEILPQVGTLLRGWQSRPSDAGPARQLLRHLHTLKGSARMAGAMRLGEVAHDIEARVESAARLHEVPAALFEELLAAHDRSLELFDQLQNPVAAPLPQVAVGDAPAATAGEAASFVSEAVSADGAGGTTADGPTVAPSRARDAREASKQASKHASQQAVRVNSETLDRLVNLAGEVSISRARIENEILQIKGAMSDLGENVERLKSQLREIELQAELQMQSQMQSQHAPGHEREKFDPLEFDRFTRFQELTRMMAESVNDVKTLQQHLQKSLDTAETDLASQRRMTRDLQQDLMRVRMVPFASIAERLYRVARRTAKEVDKRVNLDIRGGSVEIDRGVLERMAGPFEHLLRNHIVHGIETRDARRAAGKDETGELLVEVRQEGNEIVLTFSDDGSGLDLQRIRRKGRELGLVDEHDLSDAQAAELIFHPGFSTASEVTELAGRGVGMDVVRAEAVTLAGRVSVDSEFGRGTRFTINLPLTLAITQVVLVSVASRTYALPAVLVEQVQQLRPQPLADAYRAGHLEWAGAPVRLAFLGTLLGIDDSVPVAQRTSPVLVLRSAGDRVAVHVDEVVGNQEVVVKNLGPQLARMTGIAGATVLGSGEIVLILNPVQLAQMTRATATVVQPVSAGDPADVPAGVPALVEGADLHTLPTVMVVDDSLTVRRVTQRLLSREGYQVVLAKDGVDALEQLQDFPPDVMLVDIEMPRMDGFDLTRNVRNDDRYKHIPIIMITSRTAEKHRQHAADLGVDAYLGKPYQEDELLELLTTYVGAKRGHPA